MNKTEYELFKHFSEEYTYIKTRLMNMDYPNNPVKLDAEYINILLEEIDELKDKNARHLISKSNQSAENSKLNDTLREYESHTKLSSLPWYARIYRAIVNKPL